MRLNRRTFGFALIGSPALARPRNLIFPGAHWESREPSALGLDPGPLDQLSESLGGHGCVVKDGWIVKAWGDQAERRDWLSSAKPVLSTLLFFAVQEKRLPSVDAKIAPFGWALREKDRPMTFRHLASMTSGYARPEAPGAAWAYNDFAIQLYQQTLFDRVFQEDAEAVANHESRLGFLQLEDKLAFSPRRRLTASVRDFARIAWFWLQQGKWGDRQLLDRRFFRRYQKPDVPFTTPQTQPAETDDYLRIGSFGGGSDHFTQYGPGIYGFNWWFNARGRLHPDQITWPDAPHETIMSIGAGGNCSALFPSQGVILASSRGKWGQLKGGDPASPFNQNLKLLRQACRI